MRPFALIACLLAFSVWTGCEEGLPVQEGVDEPFSLYGVITPQLDTQWVRVFPITPSLEPTTPDPLRGLFTSTNLPTGVAEVWQDSVFVDSDSQFSHVFWRPMKVDFGDEFEVRMEREDGAASTAIVKVPPKVRVDHSITSLEWPVQANLFVRDGAPRLLRITTRYEVQFAASPLAVRIYEFPYLGRLKDLGSTWEFPIQLALEYENVVGRLDTEEVFDDDFGVILKQMQLRFMVVNEEWQLPPGADNTDFLIEPGVLDNVSNGLGFVGAGYRVDHGWMPDSLTMTSAGFRVD